MRTFIDKHDIKKFIENSTEEEITSELDNIRDFLRKKYSNNRTLDNVMSLYCRGPISKRYGYNSDLHKLSKDTVKISYQEKKEIIEWYKNYFIDKLDIIQESLKAEQMEQLYQESLKKP